MIKVEPRTFRSSSCTAKLEGGGTGLAAVEQGLDEKISDTLDTVHCAIAFKDEYQGKLCVPEHRLGMSAVPFQL